MVVTYHFVRHLGLAGLQTNFFHQEHRGPLLKILGAQTDILGLHTVNQHANQIFTSTNFHYY